MPENYPNYPTDKLNVNIRGMLLAVVSFLVIAYYGVTALSARDAVWFTNGFNELPARVVIHKEGQRTELRPGQPTFDLLAESVRQSLDKGVDYASGIGFSQGSLDDAFTMFVTLEVYFSQPVKLHASFNTGEPDQMLFPITGRHSESPLVLLGRSGQWMANAPVLKTIEPIRAVLKDMGYLP